LIQKAIIILDPAIPGRKISMDQQNPKKLYIGNLPYSVTEDQLRDLFSQFGEIVDLKLITDKMSGRSRGIAFVEYTSDEDANKAIEATNNTELDGRAIVVNVARPPKPRTEGGFGGGNRGGGGYGR
jgi:RNA recognition motif-containing protein